MLWDKLVSWNMEIWRKKSYPKVICKWCILIFDQWNSTHNRDVTLLKHICLTRWRPAADLVLKPARAISSFTYWLDGGSFSWQVCHYISQANWAFSRHRPTGVGRRPVRPTATILKIRGVPNSGFRLFDRVQIVLWTIHRIRIRIALPAEHIDAAPAVLIFTTSSCPSL